MQDSVFTKIIRGEIPCHKVYEDQKTFAFLDIHPIQPGNVLLVPKEQVAFAWDLADEDYHALMETARKVALRIREVFPDKLRVAMHIEGLDVAHAHLKLFPFSTDEEFRNHAALADIAAKLRMEDQV
jgi:histidine triad (HIT) family protein